MKYLDEYRDPAIARRLLDELRATATRPWTVMEVCGGQTHTIVRQGIDELLPAGVRMIHGPGCPVCVTPLEILDKAQAIARARRALYHFDSRFGCRGRAPTSPSAALDVSRRLFPY
jgi:hydrogenase expression/formation protein HypD